MDCLSVRMSSVTLMHPAKAVGQSEISFGMDTHVVPSNIKGRLFHMQVNLVVS